MQIGVNRKKKQIWQLSEKKISLMTSDFKITSITAIWMHELVFGMGAFVSVGVHKKKKLVRHINTRRTEYLQNLPGLFQIFSVCVPKQV